MTEDEMVGWHHRLDGHESEQTQGVGEGQESLACCSPWGCKESDTTQRLNNNNLEMLKIIHFNGMSMPMKQNNSIFTDLDQIKQQFQEKAILLICRFRIPHN